MSNRCSLVPNVGTLHRRNNSLPFRKPQVSLAKESSDMSTVRVAAAAYTMKQHSTFAAYAQRIEAWVERAAVCDVLVFPEYAALEMASIGADAPMDLPTAFERTLAYGNEAAELFGRLAAQYDCTILAPSGPAFEGPATRTDGAFDGTSKANAVRTNIAVQESTLQGEAPSTPRFDRPILNRAVLYGPRGVIGHQDKQIVTPTDRQQWHLSSPTSPNLHRFATTHAILGVLICYDSEFPLLARRLAVQGVEILLVPSFTSSVAGYHRVRIGSMARALESQCVVVHAPLIGASEWLPGIGQGYGTAGIYGPPDGYWPETGIIDIGTMNTPGWTYADIDLDRVKQSRESGAVLTFSDWGKSQ